jgi:hypothetical protein
MHFKVGIKQKAKGKRQKAKVSENDFLVWRRPNGKGEISAQFRFLPFAFCLLPFDFW